MIIKLNQQQRWLVEQVAASEDFTGDLAGFVTEVVRRYLAEVSAVTSEPAASA